MADELKWQPGKCATCERDTLVVQYPVIDMALLATDPHATEIKNYCSECAEGFIYIPPDTPLAVTPSDSERIAALEKRVAELERALDLRDTYEIEMRERE